MILKVYFLNSILENVNGYFLEHTTHHPKRIFIILIMYIKAFDNYNSYEKRLFIEDLNTEISEPRIQLSFTGMNYIIL